MVKGIEELAAELQSDVLGHREIAQQRHVQVNPMGSSDDSQTLVAKCEGSRLGERPCIEPTIHRALIGWKVGIARDVCPLQPRGVAIARLRRSGYGCQRGPGLD